MRFVCPLPLSVMLGMHLVWRNEHTLGFLRRGNGCGVDVEAAGAIDTDGVGFGVASSNTTGDDGGGEERFMVEWTLIGYAPIHCSLMHAQRPAFLSLISGTVYIYTTSCEKLMESS
jgi:hypothetical protein